MQVGQSFAKRPIDELPKLYLKNIDYFSNWNSIFPVLFYPKQIKIYSYGPHTFLLTKVTKQTKEGNSWFFYALENLNKFTLKSSHTDFTHLPIFMGRFGFMCQISWFKFKQFFCSGSPTVLWETYPQCLGMSQLRNWITFLCIFTFHPPHNIWTLEFCLSASVKSSKTTKKISWKYHPSCEPKCCE